MEYDGMTAMVTGAGHGIGRATAMLFAARGAKVVLADLELMRAEAVARECHGEGHLAVEVDLRSSESVAAMVEMAVREVGRVHALANVAGIYPAAPMIDTTDDMWRAVLATNLDGTFHTCRALAPHMLEAGGGAIVNVSTGATRMPFPGLSAYAASKGGVVSFTRTIAVELAPTVRANVVAPGPTSVPDDLTHQDRAALQASTIPLGRPALPEEVAEAITFLASSRARFITGQTLNVNGGRSMR
jgi:NAD(P)-dependent dehydrogenase (short-subunit alcohol dehydrogenase family)